MSDRPRVLLQLDTDQHPSSFDAIVAIDSGVDHLLQYARVAPERLEGLVHGGMFTRGPQDLRYTAVFIGGSDVELGQRILDKVVHTYFGPFRMSVMMDGNGCNTTASAAVLCAGRHVTWAGTTALVLGGTGPVGTRVARLLLREGARVLLASRTRSRAQQAIDALLAALGGELEPVLQPIGLDSEGDLNNALQTSEALFACGAAGIELLSENQTAAAANVRVAVDLNAVPPAGIAGIAPTDFGQSRGQRVDYGALGVGGLKMKIHRRAIAALFESNDRILDTEAIYDLGRQLVTPELNPG